MNSKADFSQIATKIDNIIDVAIDKSLVDSYPTQDLLTMIDIELEDIISDLQDLADTDVYEDITP